MTISKQKKTFISICIPVYNEELNIQNLYSQIDEISILVSKNVNFEFIFTDNNSSDSSWSIIKALSRNDSRIRAFKFTKNVGFQQSIHFNYMQAKGNAAVQIDADLQDPPSLIIDFIQGWVEGYKVVVGVRRNRNESKISSGFRKIGYLILSKIARFRITENAGDFRLIDREVIEILRQSQNPDPYLRGAIAGLGFPEKRIIYDRNPRKAGRSKFNFISVVKLGLKGIINYSNLLLRASQGTFVISLLLSLCGITLYAISKLFKPDSNYPPGFTTIVVLSLISLTINSLFFAVCIKYVQAIHHIVTKNEPIVVLEKIE